MTNDELIALKALAESCYIFGNEDNLDERERRSRAIKNERFFVKAVKCVSDLIDELIELRELKRLYDNYELC